MQNKCVWVVVVLSVGCASAERDWKGARSSDTREAYLEFLREHPDADRYRPLALQRLEALQYEEALQVGTIEAHQRFLEDHPRGEFSEKAKSSIVRIEWENTKRANSIEAYRGFVNKHSTSELAQEAMSRIELKEWEGAQRVDTTTAYEDFARKYPNGEFAQEANARVERLKLERAAWGTVTRTPTLKAYFMFVEDFPRSKKHLSRQALRRIAVEAQQSGEYSKRPSQDLRIDRVKGLPDGFTAPGDYMRNLSYKVMRSGRRFTFNPPASTVDNEKGYFMHVYSNANAPLVMDLVEDGAFFDFSYVSGGGFVLVSDGVGMRMWEF